MTQKLWPWYSAEAVERVSRRIASGVNLGQQAPDQTILDLENIAVRRLGHAKQFALSFSSGTSALQAAYGSLGLRGKTVLVPTHTFRATVTPLRAIGATPIFFGVDPATGAPALEITDSTFLERASAIVITHVNGILVDMSKILEMAEAYNLRVVEDCSHAHGAVYEDGERAGAHADVAVFSMGTTKLVSGGLGGLALFKNRDVFERAVKMGQPKWRLEREIQHNSGLVGDGFHHRMSPVSAMLATDHLAHLDEILRQKSQAIAALSRVVESHPRIAAVRPGRGTNQGLYKLHLVARDAALALKFIDCSTGVGLRARRVSRPMHESAEYLHSERTTSCDNATTFVDRLIEFDCFDLHDDAQAEDVNKRFRKVVEAS